MNFELEGVLLKMGEGAFKSFKKRWFKVGNDGKLYYFDKKGDLKEKGFIDLTQVVSVTVSTDSDAQKNKLYEFNITTTKRIYQLRTVSESDMNRWIEGLDKIVAVISNMEVPVAAPKPKSLQLYESARPVTKEFSALSALSSIVSSTPSVSKAQQSIAPQPIASPPPTERVASAPPTDTLPNNVATVKSVEPVAPIEPLQSGEPTPKSRHETPFRMSMNLFKSSSPAPVTPAKVDLTSSSPQLNVELTRTESIKAEKQPSDKNVANMRNMLETARKAVEERDKRIAELLAEVERQRVTITELQTTLDSTKVINDDIGYERRRNEEETQKLRKQLEIETRNREEFERRNQEMANELRLLKETIQNFYQDDRKAQAKQPPPSPVRSQSMREIPRLPDSPVQSSKSMASVATMTTASQALIVRELNALEFWKRSPARWVEDTETTECKTCRTQFNFFVRRHHCRNCGYIFCDTCSAFLHKVPGYERLQRVCGPCFKECHTMLQLLEEGL